jgi:lysyl-tRNA synthetase class 2
MSNPPIRDIFYTRAKIIQFVRRFLDNRGFLEVRLSLLFAGEG